MTETLIFKNAAVASIDQSSEDSSDSVSLVFESFQIANEPGATAAADTLVNKTQ